MTRAMVRAHRMLIMACLLLSCSGGSTGPAAGTLNVQLGSPHPDDGAVLFTVTGGRVEQVEAMQGSVYSATLDANTVRVIVIGDLTSGTIAHLRIPDGSQASHYTAVVNQVAARSTYEPRDPQSYSLTLAP